MAGRLFRLLFAACIPGSLGLSFSAPTSSAMHGRRVTIATQAAFNLNLDAACTRRKLPFPFVLAALALGPKEAALASSPEDMVRMEGLRGEGKTKTFFPDFTKTPSGLQYKDYKVGTGRTAGAGEQVIVDWTGVTIGYQGRYFQARNKPQGGDFAGDGEAEFLAFRLGDGSMIPGVDEAVRGMQVGGVRRIIVPEEIGYPKDGFKTVGPKPSSFSGERALDFVLSSKGSLVDKTLMFDLKLVKVSTPK